MSELADQVKESFNDSMVEQMEKSMPGLGTVYRTEDADSLAPGFAVARAFYDRQLTVRTRRGYHFFAGATLPRGCDELVEQTRQQMLENYTPLLMESYCDGVLIGQRVLPMVQLALRYDMSHQLWHSSEFRHASVTMAKGFAADQDVLNVFTGYLQGGLEQLGRLTGIAHQEMEPARIWDLWVLVGQACTAACYLAGHRLGRVWAERDLLDGIEIATAGNPNRQEDGDA